MITVLHEQRETTLPGAQAHSGSLWLDRASIEQATGWTWKPEGLCQGDTCVPLPRTQTSIVRDGLLDMAEMWRYMGHPVAHDAGSNAWVLGTGSAARSNVLSTLEAPDFALPDLAGRMHQLSDYRGKKVLLATWASW